MKYLIVVLFLALFTIIGCDNDNILNITENSVNNSEVIFELDSLGINTLDTGWIYQMKTYTNIPVYNPSIRVEFTGYTNLNSSSQMSLYVSASKSVHNYFSYYVDNPTTINQFHSFNITSTGRGNYLNFIAEILYANASRYIYFKNIKVYTN